MPPFDNDFFKKWLGRETPVKADNPNAIELSPLELRKDNGYSETPEDIGEDGDEDKKKKKKKTKKQKERDGEDDDRDEESGELPRPEYNPKESSGVMKYLKKFFTGHLMSVKREVYVPVIVDKKCREVKSDRDDLTRAARLKKSGKETDNVYPFRVLEYRAKAEDAANSDWNPVKFCHVTYFGAVMGGTGLSAAWSHTPHSRTHTLSLTLTLSHTYSHSHSHSLTLILTTTTIT